ncbi:hypothetical protein GH714_009726 [Hevea brasiliensis]|uniref:Uncharacterized protein n=1 Tax=Hevea brasiliensis TaxID=3981 RepID=A0A6A6MJP9_HEVBR|nr:hypothetical protein GH714_009726 [Hevea brasiliensis]
MAYVSGKPILSDEEFDNLKLKLKQEGSEIVVEGPRCSLRSRKGPCPNCGNENQSFFGTILSVSSGGSTNSVKRSNCGTEMVYDSKTRLITLPEGSNALFEKMMFVKLDPQQLICCCVTGWKVLI